MQRIVKWTEGWSANDNEHPNYVGGGRAAEEHTNDLEPGAVFALDLTRDGLQAHPDLLAALTLDGVLGHVTAHSWFLVSSKRIWTFVVEF